MTAETMRSAIYYPHVSPFSEGILRTALLLWDELEFVVPWNGFVPDQQDEIQAAAVEVMGRFRVPTTQEKKLAHERIEDFATGPLPDAFRYVDPSPHSDSQLGYMYAGKLLPETWHMLRELQLAGPERHRGHGLRDAAGLALMSILTDCCGGATKARVTDRTTAYAQLTDMLVAKDAEEKFAAANVREAFVPITLSLVDASSVSLASLVEFRRREAKRSGQQLRELRARYRARVEDQVAACSQVQSSADLGELTRQFELDLRDDLVSLKEELRLAKGEALTSKEVVVMAVSGLAAADVGASVLHWPGVASAAALALPTIGGLINARLKYAKERRQIIQRHPMAYMLEVEELIY